MVKRIRSAGIRAQYLLIDSWFTMPAIVTALAEHIDVIGMVKKSSKIFYRYNGHAMDLMNIYGKLKKRLGRAKILRACVKINSHFSLEQWSSSSLAVGCNALG